MKKLFTFLLLFVMLGVTNGFALPGQSQSDPFITTKYYKYNVAFNDVSTPINGCLYSYLGNHIPGTDVFWDQATDWNIEVTYAILGYTLPSSIQHDTQFAISLGAQTVEYKNHWYMTYTVTCKYQGKTYTGYGRINLEPYYELNKLEFSPSSETVKRTTETYTKSLSGLLVNNNNASNQVSQATKHWSVTLVNTTGYTDYQDGDYSISETGVFKTTHAGTYKIRCEQGAIWNYRGTFYGASAEYTITVTEDPLKWDKQTYYTSPGSPLDITLFNNMGPWGVEKPGPDTYAYTAGSINWGGYESSLTAINDNVAGSGMYPYARKMRFITAGSPGIYTISAERTKRNDVPYTTYTATATIVVQQNNTLSYNDNITITSQQAKTYTPTPRTSNSTAAITYTYKNNNTGAVTDTPPTAPGVYTVTATQAATGNSIYDYPAKEVTFTVTVTAPIIADTETTRSWKVKGDQVPVEHEFVLRSPPTNPLTFTLSQIAGFPSTAVTAVELTSKNANTSKVTPSSDYVTGTALELNTKTSTSSRTYSINSNETSGQVCVLKLYMNDGSINTVTVTFAPASGVTGMQKTKSYAEEAIAVQLDRTFAEGWNTLCLPFDLTRKQFEEAFGTDAKIYEFTDVRDETNTMLFSTVDFSTVVDGGVAVAACTPYLMHLVNAVEDPGFDGVIPIDPSKSSYSSSMTVSQTVNGHTYTYLGNVLVTTIDTNTNPGSRYLTASGNLKKPSDSGLKMKGMRAYFIYPAAHDANAKAAQMSFVDDSATAISELIESGMIEFNDTCEYSINGQRVNAEYKGIVIRNGKKYLRK